MNILASVRYEGKTYYNSISIDYSKECLDDCIVEYGRGNISAYHVDCQLPANLELPEYGSSEQGYGITIASLGEGWLLPIETSTTEPVKMASKPTTKNSAVCTIAAKLAKRNVRNPMSIAWKLYRITLDCLNAISKKCYFDFYAYAYQLECILVQHRVTDISHVLPTNVCTVFRKHALSVTI